MSGQSDFWGKSARRAMHPAHAANPTPAPAIKPPHEWATDGVAGMLDRCFRNVRSEYLRRLGELAPRQP